MTIDAVLPPPNLQRFCELAEVAADAVEASRQRTVYSGATTCALKLLAPLHLHTLHSAAECDSAIIFSCPKTLQVL